MLCHGVRTKIATGAVLCQNRHRTIYIDVSHYPEQAHNFRSARSQGARQKVLCLAAAFGGAASCRLNRHRVADRPPQAARSDTVTPQKFILHRSGLLCQAARSEMPYRPSSGWPNIVRGKSLVTKSGGCCGTGCCAGQRAAPAPRLMSAL